MRKPLAGKHSLSSGPAVEPVGQLHLEEWEQDEEESRWPRSVTGVGQLWPHTRLSSSSPETNSKMEVYLQAVSWEPFQGQQLEESTGCRPEQRESWAQMLRLQKLNCSRAGMAFQSCLKLYSSRDLSLHTGGSCQGVERLPRTKSLSSPKCNASKRTQL